MKTRGNIAYDLAFIAVFAFIAFHLGLFFASQTAEKVSFILQAAGLR